MMNMNDINRAADSIIRRSHLMRFSRDETIDLAIADYCFELNPAAMMPDRKTRQRIRIRIDSMLDRP